MRILINLMAANDGGGKGEIKKKSERHEVWIKRRVN